MTDQQCKNVLFLCTGNSARSILSEAILNRLGGDEFRAFSAGSQPAGKVNPYAIRLLEHLGYDIEGLRSKSWDEFAAPVAPVIDYVITVCSNAAGEICPLWHGNPVKEHWDIDDPAAVEGTDSKKRDAFTQTYRTLEGKIKSFLNKLPGDSE